MRSDPLTGRRFPMLGSIVLACLLASCFGDDATRPESGPGLYRLKSVNGQPLPYSNPPVTHGPIEFGDLLLRPDGTYAWIMMDPQLGWPVLVSGQWTLDGTELLLWSTSGHEKRGHMAGDSVVMEVDVAVMTTWEYVFRRSKMPDSPIASGTYVLTSVDGQSDLSVEYQTARGRFAERVLYDTLTFHERLYSRQARAERAVARYPASAPDSVCSFRAWAWHGPYTGSGDTLILADLGGRRTERVRLVDTLAAGGVTLTRRIPRWDPETEAIVIREEVYTRLP